MTIRARYEGMKPESPLSELYLCTACGAVVVETETHDEWHARQELAASHQRRGDLIA